MSRAGDMPGPFAKSDYEKAAPVHGSGLLCLFANGEVGAGKLYGGWVAAAWRGDGMHAAAVRAATDEGRKGEGAATPLTVRFNSAARDRCITQSAAVGVVNKLDQGASLRKRSAAGAVAASAIAHNIRLLAVNRGIFFQANIAAAAANRNDQSQKLKKTVVFSTELCMMPGD